MVKDLVTITEKEIDESANQFLESILEGNCCNDLSDYYANKMVALENSNDKCRLGNHGPFLFVEDVSDSYSSALENKVIYRCVCLKCGKLDDFQMSRKDRRMVIRTGDSNFSIYDVNNLRIKYYEMLSKGIDEEEIVQIMNNFYKKKSKKLTKKATN